MPAMNRWWLSPEFAAFLPSIKATAANDKRNAASPRFDLRAAAPRARLDAALAYRAPCVHCGLEIAPFRERKGGDGTIFLAVACAQETGRLGCSRGRNASIAYQEIWRLLRAQQVALF